jgi:hypothetical protein
MIRRIELSIGSDEDEEDESNYHNHVSRDAFIDVMSIAIAMDQDLFPLANILDLTRC